MASTLTKGKCWNPQYDVRECVACGGQGSTCEIYNYRRLERSCNVCVGRGVVLMKDGKVYEGAICGAGLHPSNLRPAGDEQQRIARLQVDIQKIVSKTKQYDDEIRALKESPPADTPEQEQLKNALIYELEKQTERLATYKKRLEAILHPGIDGTMGIT